MANMDKLLVLSVAAVLLGLANAGPASFITKCKLDDSKCLKDSAQAVIPIFAAGVPELEVKPLDPFVFNNLDASSKNLKLKLADTTVTGLKGCKAKKIEMDKNKLSVKLLCDAELNGQYEMGGQLLILPIEGKGKVHVLLRKIQISADLELTEKDKNGKKYWNVKRWSHKYELKDKADVNFENLFNGNEALGRAARDLLASNGNDIVLEVGPPIVKALVSEVVSSIKKFFNNVPIEDLILE